MVYRRKTKRINNKPIGAYFFSGEKVGRMKESILPVDVEFYSALAKRIEEICLANYKRTTRAVLQSQATIHPELRISARLIALLIKRDFTDFNDFPSLQALDLICQILGFSLMDVIKFTPVEKVIVKRNIEVFRAKKTREKKLKEKEFLL